MELSDATEKITNDTTGLREVNILNVTCIQSNKTKYEPKEMSRINVLLINSYYFHTGARIAK
jgi:hypothetical protein